jgi:hypothetical protein
VLQPNSQKTGCFGCNVAPGVALPNYFEAQLESVTGESSGEANEKFKGCQCKAANGTAHHKTNHQKFKQQQQQQQHCNGRLDDYIGNGDLKRRSANTGGSPNGRNRSGELCKDQHCLGKSHANAKNANLPSLPAYPTPVPPVVGVVRDGYGGGIHTTARCARLVSSDNVHVLDSGHSGRNSSWPQYNTSNESSDESVRFPIKRGRSKETYCPNNKGGAGSSPPVKYVQLLIRQVFLGQKF